MKAIFILCASALLVQSALSQCAGRFGYGGYGLAPFAYDGFGYGGFPGVGYGGYGGFGCGFGGYGGYGPYANYGIGPGDVGTGFGGGLVVTSTSPMAPIGLFVTSENAIDGALAVQGNLPFLGAVATEGAFPTAGAGAVSYGCGNGAVGIAEAGVPALAPAIAPAVAPVAALGIGAYGYGGYPAAGLGCGCGAVY
ncbi:hypothetical protein K1T71_014192 [Dendrolimus kikuchii]|uniref:Uncharacterized protein n=1 Tax=Dendrolimus kikuchii TaxID=765133 RepID=A0ACC1CFB0_9NEOP|nr:hypothetical protein K1T71_014192 [Dendrolimus kikuchii]